MKTLEHICTALWGISMVGEIVTILITCFTGVTDLIRSFAMAFGILFLISVLFALAMAEMEDEMETKRNDNF